MVRRKNPAMKGGFFLTDKFTQHALAQIGPVPGRADARYVKLFYTTLNASTSRFKLLSDSSLYGFMFQHDVNPGSEIAEEYVFNNASCTQATANPPRFSDGCFKPLGSYIHKVVFVGTKNTIYAYPGNPRNPRKALESQADFAKEALLQYTLWRDFNGGISMVPPILTPDPMFVPNAEFDSHPIISRCKTDQRFSGTIANAIAAGATGVCIVTMGMAIGYTPLGDYITQVGGDTAKKHHAATLGRMAHIVLAVLFKLIHGDAHPWNIMINVNETGWINNATRGRAILIDFGRTTPVPPDQYATRIEPVISDSTRPRRWDRILRYIKEFPLPIRQNADWLTTPFFPGEVIDTDVNAQMELLETTWSKLRVFYGYNLTSSDAERIIKKTKGKISLFGPPNVAVPGPVPVPQAAPAPEVHPMQEDDLLWPTEPAPRAPAPRAPAPRAPAPPPVAQPNPLWRPAVPAAPPPVAQPHPLWGPAVPAAPPPVAQPNRLFGPPHPYEIWMDEQKRLQDAERSRQMGQILWGDERMRIAQPIGAVGAAAPRIRMRRRVTRRRLTRRTKKSSKTRKRGQKNASLRA